MNQGKEVIKAISLWQPWASLVVCGAKGIETRSWSTKVRGTVAIHAAKKPFDTTHYSDKELWPFAEALSLPRRQDFDKLPYGYILGTVDIVDYQKIIRLSGKDGSPFEPGEAELQSGMLVTPPELMFGCFSPGNYAWILDNPVMFDKPIPAKGRQGFWNVDDLIPKMFRTSIVKSKECE